MTKTTAKKTTRGAARKAAEKRAARKAPSMKKGPAKSKTAAAAKKGKSDQSKMLFKNDDLVVHENGKTYRIVKPPYARKTVITVDAVERRGNVDCGDAKAIPTSKFVRPAKAGEKSTPSAVKTKAAGPNGKAKRSAEAASDKKAKEKKPSVAAAMRELFAEHGLEATYAQAETAAKAAKPDTKFSKSHWAWYRAKHKKTVAAQSPPKARA